MHVHFFICTQVIFYLHTSSIYFCYFTFLTEGRW